ncbi:MAG: leucine-rich repeat protein [Paludibacteraceae bacterium]|nr:leucine-rich repeat protein [Paludibacteraceae bacterium]
MKTRLFTLCIALMATLRLFAGYDFTIDGICYTTLGGDSVEVGKNTNAKGAIIIPETVKTVITYRVVGIGDAAFLGCTSLTSVTIPNSVTNIGISAFYGCSSLLSISIPNNVTNIDNNAFRGCTSLTSVTIPNSVMSIGDYAFYGCTGLTSITIPNRVTYIGEYTFKGCTSLTSVTIGESVSEIGKSAFESCTSLTSVVWNAIHCVNFINPDAPFPNSVTSFTFGEKVEHVPAYLCYDMSVLASITIPNSVTSIGGGAFSGCSSLTSVTIPNSVTSIGTYAFQGCSSLSSVTIPNNVTSIEAGAFSGCSSLTSVTIPNGVTSIGGTAFSGCSSLTSVTIPNSVTSIGETAFSGCSSLTSITLPDSIKNIKYWTFESCSSLTSITIPNSVTYIDYNAFRGCSSLTSVTIGESVSEIGNSAFENCTSLTSITIGESVSKIGYSAFSGCSSLTSITIPNSIRSIGDWAFRDCSSLTYIELLYIYIVIPDDALRGCINLTDIYVPCGGLAWMQQTWNDNLRQENRLKYKPLPYTVTTIATNGSVSVPQNQCDEMEVIAIPDYGYHFVQWSDGNTENPRSIELTKDTVFSAEFAPNIYSFSASCNENYGSVQATNGNYEYLTELTISATANEGYHFVQWSDGNTDNPRTIILSQDTSFTAEFAPNIYVITFMNDDSTVISAQQYGYGQMPIAPEFPTKAATAEYTYTFAGWIPEIVAVIGDATYKATFNATKNSYSITWLNEDGSLIDQTTVEYGVVPTHADPIKENTAEYTYTFAGWIPNVVAVTCDATYRATFNGEVNMYSITTSAINGEVEGAGIYAYGTEIEIKAIPAEGYTFDQWSDSVKDNPRTIIVTSDAEYTALFIQSQGIDDVYATDPVKKVINNDKIYILRGNKTYTLQGQEVK